MVVARLGWILSGIVVATLAIPLLGEAAVLGTCSVCHTMHNSEQGSVVAFSRDSAGQPVLREQAFAKLLKTDCLGCHTHTGAETIVDMADAQVPIVFNLTEPTYPPDGSPTSALAGGNFHWLIKNGDAYGHNVHGIVAEDLRFPPTLAPGGVIRVGDCGSCHGTLTTPESGCTGCHVPQHHANGPGAVADRGQGWYRFLGSVMQSAGQTEPTVEGVIGIEAPDWEQNPQASLHNVYEGEPGSYEGYLQSGSISQKCAGCHGRYHSESIADATWIRHPGDALIPNAGEFATMGAYNPLVPVARRNITAGDANFALVTPGADLVTCISCHRPHGSPYPAMLRWGYRSWPGTDDHTGQPAVNGCAVCHTSKG
jgi:hypothetical protein